MTEITAENEKYLSWAYRLPEGKGRKVLVTGITGMEGSSLAHLLLSRGFEVHGLVRWHSRRDRIEDISGHLILHEANLTDPYTLSTAIKASNPEIIFHMAGHHFVPASWRAPLETMKTNVLGTTNLLETVRRYCSSARVILFGSGEQYGMNKKDILTEEDVFRPVSPYAVSKVAADYLGYQYWVNYHLHIVRLRVFNILTPGARDISIVNILCRLFAEAEIKKTKEVYVPGYNLVRDFLDYRDAAKGYLMAAEKGRPGEAYNICSGQGLSIGTIASKLREFITVKPVIHPKEEELSEIEVMVGSREKIANDTGWIPEIELDHTLREMYEFWASYFKSLEKS